MAKINEEELSAIDLLMPSTLGASLKTLGGSERGLELIRFAHLLIVDTIEQLIARRYSLFDPHVPSNSCHIVSVMKLSLLAKVDYSELDRQRLIGRKNIERLSSGLPSYVSDRGVLDLVKKRASLADLERHLDLLWKVPAYLIELAKFRALRVAEVDHPTGGQVCDPGQLRTLGAPIATNYLRRLVANYQRQLIDQTAQWCDAAAFSISPRISSAGLPVKQWAKYLHSDYRRWDHRGRTYVASLYSMQVVLCHLKQSQGIIGLLCDHLLHEGSKRHVQLLQWEDGSWNPIEPNHDSALPIVMFGGISHSPPEQVWNDFVYNQFDDLILECDTYYPHFPYVSNSFDSSPIYPDESRLIAKLSKAFCRSGVSLMNPSRFCLSHVFVASMSELRSAKAEPWAFLAPVLPPRVTKGSHMGYFGHAMGVDTPKFSAAVRRSDHSLRKAS